MKDIVRDRLNRIHDLKDRQLLKGVLLDVFESVVDYNMDMYARLEKRIYDEIPDPLDKYYIYTCLERADAVDPIDGFLHPMVESDAQSAHVNMDELSEKMRNGESAVLASAYMECDCLTLKQLLGGSGNSYKASVTTNIDGYEIGVAVRQSVKYVEQIEMLYLACQLNGVKWNTVNCPYAYKFIDVVPVEPLPLKSGERVKKIAIDLAGYEKYRISDVVPLWNIKRLSIQDQAFPIAMRDAVGYEHIISLEKTVLLRAYILPKTLSGIYSPMHIFFQMPLTGMK
jgi:hypothetical protein